MPIYKMKNNISPNMLKIWTYGEHPLKLIKGQDCGGIPGECDCHGTQRECSQCCGSGSIDSVEFDPVELVEIMPSDVDDYDEATLTH